MRIDYSVEREVLLGTGGALRLAEPFIESHALVLNGDTYLAEDYGRILEHHFAERSVWNVVATLTLARHEEAERLGTVQLDSAELCQWIPREGAIPHEMRIPECRRLRCRTRIDRVDPSGPAMLAGAGGLSERTRVECSDRLVPKLPTLLRYRYARRFPEVPRPLSGLVRGTSRTNSKPRAG